MLHPIMQAYKNMLCAALCHTDRLRRADFHGSASYQCSIYPVSGASYLALSLSLAVRPRQASALGQVPAYPRPYPLPPRHEEDRTVLVVSRSGEEEGGFGRIQERSKQAGYHEHHWYALDHGMRDSSDLTACCSVRANTSEDPKHRLSDVQMITLMATFLLAGERVTYDP